MYYIAKHLNKSYMKFILLSMGLIAMALYLWALYEEMKEAQELKRKRRNYILNNHKQTKQ